VSELTGEQLTEKFFTEFKGWEWKLPDGWKPGSSNAWVGRSGRLAYDKTELPPLHASLDLQEEELWPELFSKKVYLSDIDYYPDEKLYKCRIQGMVVDGRGTAPTKALAQLQAGLKALGVI